MYKTLIKKQLLELNSFYFMDRKTGKRRSKKGIIGITVLYVFIFLFLALAFFSLGMLSSSTLAEMGLNWVYFALFGVSSLLFGTFGSVFNTYASLYKSKDNELLLSLPLKPSAILLSRLLGVYSMSLLYSGLIWIPAVIAYWITVPVTVTSLLYPALLTLILALLVMVLSCLLGWVVALLSVKLKYKKFVTVVISLLFFIAYYWFCMNMSSFLEQFLFQAAVMGSMIQNNIYPLYLLGKAACGDSLSMLLFTAGIVALTALCCYVMSRTFQRIVASTPKERRVAYKEKSVSVRSVKKALFHRELSHYTSSTTYMLNTGLGILVFPALAVIMVLKRDQLDQITSVLPLILSSLNVDPQAILHILFASALCMITSMDGVTAPSVSLEGKTVWLMQSLPVDPYEVLLAKEQLQIVLNILPILIPTVTGGILLGFSPAALVLCILLVLLYLWFCADLGLFFGLLKPNLNWTNETAPIKQSASVAFVLFGGWILSVLYGAGFFLASRIMSETIYLLLGCVLLLILVILLRIWLKRKGSKIFASL